MNKKDFLIYAFLIGLWAGGQAFADWQGAGTGGTVITFDSVTNGSKQIPKHVSVDAGGTQVGTTSNPIFTSPISGGNAAAISPTGALSANVTQLGGASVSAANPVPTTQNVGGTIVTAANPLPLQLSQGGVAVSGSNGLPSQLVVSGAAVSSGNPLPVATSQSEPITYSISAVTTIPTNITDFVIIQGSSTKLVKIKRIGVSFGNSGSAYVNVYRRSTAHSGGTCAAPTIVKHDTSDPSSTVANAWVCTANPTPGTTVARARSAYANGGVSIIEWVFGGVNDKPLYIRGTSDFITLNADGSNSATTALWYVEWTEE